MAYSIGKIRVEKNNATITGAYTQFIDVAKVQPGDLLYAKFNEQDTILQVAQVLSNTQLRLAQLDGQVFNPSISGDNLSYGIVQNFNNTTNARLAKSLTELQAKWHRRERELTGWFQSNEATFPVTNFLGEQSEISTPAEINRNAVKVTQLIDELEVMVASIAQAAQNADDAAASASAAAASKTAAKISETNAAASKVAAKSSEDAAKASQSAAAGSAISAGLSKSAAASSKAAAADSAAAALASEEASKASETAVASSASSAASSKTAAASSQSAAASSANSAAASKGAAKTSETNAAASKVAAKASEDAAKASQSAATGSATSAASSKSAAKASENKAADYASAALASEDASKASETAAASSASSAASSRTAAASSQSAAASSASSAATSKGAAKTSETHAAASKVAAKASEDAAKESQSAAAGSATSAASSKLAAKASEDKAADYASAALASEGAAKGSETAAASSASSAASSKTAAASSKSAAASSASSAATSKGAAKTSETHAAASKVAAKASEDAAKESQSAAAGSATSAASSKLAAKASEDKAADYASAALASEGAAKGSETAAASSASSAASSKTAAASSKSAAASSASSAATSKGAAKTSETNAAASKVAAKASEDAAKASQSAATGSATSAASSKSAAKVSEDKAADYASAALASEGAAKGSETAAASSASSAASSKTAAASSKSAAASSASAAVVSKTAAKTSETNAASSASAAAASKAAAKISETNAAQSAATAQTSQAAAKTSEDNAANSVFEAQSIRNEVAEIAGGTAPDSQRLGGKTKAEVVSEARAGLQAADSKLQRLVDSEFDFTHGNDFRIRDGRALAAHTPEVLYVNYNGDFSNVSAKGAWTFSEPVTVSDVTLEATTGEYGDKALKVSNTRGYLKLGAQNNNFCHYETDRPNHWFNKEVRVQGEIYAGSGYSQKVYHEGHKPTPNEIGAVAKGESITLTNQEIVWSENSDGARIGFKNDADNDANSYLYFQTSDNLNEYFKWQHQTGASTVEWMSLKNASLSVKGRINAAGATFDAGNSTTVNIRANSSGAAVLNVCAEADAQTTGIVYVGQSPNHGGGIEYNGDNSPVTSDSGADFFTLFRRSNGQTHWTARNHQANNNWEFRSEVKAASFKEGNTPLTNKYHPKSAKLARFESSEIDTSGQDFKIRNKRVLVGATDKLVINYNADWAKVDARGEWDFNGDILARYDIKMAGDDSYIWTPNKANGSTGLYDPHSNITAFKYTNGQGFDYGADINITKNNPWLTLDSSSSGSVNIEQAAGISIGESGRDNAASLHISYQGNGYSYIGMGDLGADNIADNWAMQMNYQSRWVKFRSDIHLQDSNTKLAKGVSNTVRAITSHGYVDIGPMNTGWCHFETDRERFYFGQSLHVKGELYAGPNYNQKVIHQGNFNQQLQASANQVTSGDSQKFAGKTEQQWQDYIQDPVRAAVAVTNPIAAAFI